MEHRIECGPSYSVLELTLQQGEKIVSDAGAMTWKDDSIETETSTRGGLGKGLKRALLSGESFFQNTYTAVEGNSLIGLAPGCAGDIVPLGMDGNELFLEKGAYLASTPDVHCDAKWSGLKGLFNEGLFVLRCSGSGMLFFHSYGDVKQIDVDGEYVVDSGFAVAWDPTLEYRISKARRIRSFLFSDQIILRFSGRGRLWVQSRSAQALANWVYPFRPQKSNN